MALNFLLFGVYWASLIYRFVSFIKFGNFSFHYLYKYSFCPFHPPHWLHYTYIGVFDDIPQVPQVLFIFLIFSPLCPLDWLISVVLSFCLLIFSPVLVQICYWTPSRELIISIVLSASGFLFVFFLCFLSLRWYRW